MQDMHLPTRCVVDRRAPIHHAVRKVPVVCALKAKGNGEMPGAKLDKGTRNDKWYRDNRSDYDVQLETRSISRAVSTEAT
jgi:hypothetical protein